MLIIDSLVIELGLDPSGFSEGQRKSTEALRQLEQRAQTSASAINATAGKSIRDYLAGFEAQFETLNKRLATLGAQSRRTGVEARAGWLLQAEGIGAVTSGALAAYAALKSIQEVIHGIGNAVGGAAQTGRAAFLTGLPVQYLSAFEQYAKFAGNVPFATTESSLQEFEQKRAAYRNFGEYAQEFTALARLGIDANMPLPQLLQAIAAAAQGKNGPDVLLWASRVGLGPLANVFARGPQAMQQGIGAHMNTAITPNQADAFQRLQGAINDVGIALDSLTRKVIELNPQWEHWAREFHDWLVDLQKTPEGLKGVELAAGLVSVAIGVTLVAAIAKFVRAVIAANAAVLATPLGKLLLLGYLGYNLVEGGPSAAQQERVEGWSAYLDPRYWLRRFFGDNSGPAGPGAKRLPGGGVEAPIGGGGQSSFTPTAGPQVDMVRQAVAAAGGNEQTQAAFLAMFNAESGMRSTTVASGGDFGWAQWIGSRKRALFAWAAAHGLNPASPEAQAGFLQNELTTNPQFASMILRMNAAVNATEAAKIGGFTFEQGGANAGLFGGGGHSQADLDAFHSKGAENYLRLIQSQRAQAAAGATSIDNSNKNSTDVGAIHVTVPPGSDGYAIGGAIHDTIVSLANTGLE